MAHFYLFLVSLLPQDCFTMVAVLIALLGDPRDSRGTIQGEAPGNFRNVKDQTGVLVTKHGRQQKGTLRVLTPPVTRET